MVTKPHWLWAIYMLPHWLPWNGRYPREAHSSCDHPPDGADPHMVGATQGRRTVAAIVLSDGADPFLRIACN